MADNKIHVHIAMAEQREGLPEYQQDSCPKCHGPVETGFGLAGGGYGVSSYCNRCQEVVSKSQVEE